MVEEAVARWWKGRVQQCPALVSMCLPPALQLAKPRTQIQYLIHNDTECISFVHTTENQLRKRCNHHQHQQYQQQLDVQAHVDLASFAMARRDYGEARRILEKILNNNNDNNDNNDNNNNNNYCHIKALLVRVERNLHDADLRKQRQQQQQQCSLGPIFRPVERRSIHDLSVENFMREFAHASKPVVITDLAVEMCGGQLWSFEYLMEMLQEKQVPLKSYVLNSIEWAQLEDCKNMSACEFISGVAQEDPRVRSLYLFDWQLPLHAPQLLSSFRVPKLFAADYLQQTEAGSLFRDSWPSLFVAPAGVHGGLHVDAFGSNFWMALLHGRKKWVFFEATDTCLLHPRYDVSFDANFDISVDQKVDRIVKKYGSYGCARGWEVMLEAGEVLFVPSGCAHQVFNETKSIAISANYIDESNVDKAIAELKHIGLLEERAQQLMEQLERMVEGKKRHVEREEDNTNNTDNTIPWDQFKHHNSNKKGKN